MDTYPRLAEGLDLAWTPDRSRIVAYNTSSGNVVATLTVKEGLFLSQLDGDVDPDDMCDFTQRERFRVLANRFHPQPIVDTRHIISHKFTMHKVYIFIVNLI